MEFFGSGSGSLFGLSHLSRQTPIGEDAEDQRLLERARSRREKPWLLLDDDGENHWSFDTKQEAEQFAKTYGIRNKPSYVKRGKDGWTPITAEQLDDDLEQDDFGGCGANDDLGTYEKTDEDDDPLCSRFNNDGEWEPEANSRKRSYPATQQGPRQNKTIQPRRWGWGK